MPRSQSLRTERWITGIYLGINLSPINCDDPIQYATVVRLLWAVSEGKATLMCQRVSRRAAGWIIWITPTLYWNNKKPAILMAWHYCHDEKNENCCWEYTQELLFVCFLTFLLLRQFYGFPLRTIYRLLPLPNAYVTKLTHLPPNILLLKWRRPSLDSSRTDTRARLSARRTHSLSTATLPSLWWEDGASGFHHLMKVPCVQQTSLCLGYHLVL